MKVSTPLNSHVPKDVRENLRWRSAVHRRVMNDPSYADVIRDACSRDPLFFINGFVFTHDSRREPFTKLPFILYEYQEEAVLEILNAINNHDLLIEKSRDTGASWMNCTAIYWCWAFKSGLSFLLGSRVEDDVDRAGNPKCLFYKLDFILDNLPVWMKPAGYNRNEHRRHLHIGNPETGSSIDGEATTIDFARGARCTAILLDEFATVPDGQRILTATRDVTKCRLFNSTPKGTNNAFYEKSIGTIKKLRIHWSKHPLKAAGLYETGSDGNVNVLDLTGYPDSYSPILDGKLRSPWYDNECERAGSAQEIAQELDIDYLGSGFQYFNAALVHESIRKYARPPMLIGELEYDETTGDPIRFREDENGNLRLWFLLDKDGKPPIDFRTVLGIDVSAGTGASNSCAEGWKAIMCEKILEYVNPFIRPEAFAKQAVAIARWLNGAEMIWESGGPGRQFGSRVMELGYGNVYLRRNDASISGKVSDIPGFASTKDTKLVLMGDYRAGIEKGNAVNRSKEALEECLEYIFDPNGGVIHARSVNKTDPSGAKSNHGDRCVGDALAYKLLNERKSSPVKQGPEVPVGCLQWRMDIKKKKEQLPNRQLDREWAT